MKTAQRHSLVVRLTSHISKKPNVPIFARVPRLVAGTTMEARQRDRNTYQSRTICRIP